MRPGFAGVARVGNAGRIYRPFFFPTKSAIACPALTTGAIASAAIRKPGPKLSAADIADIDRLIARQDKRLKELH